MAENFNIGPAYFCICRGQPSVTADWVVTYAQDVSLDVANLSALRQGAFVPAELTAGVSHPSKPSMTVQLLDTALAIIAEMFHGGVVTGSDPYAVGLPGALQFINVPTEASITGGAAGDHTVTGIATTNRLVSVYNETDTVELVGEFEITGADTINNAGGTATTADTLTVKYETGDLLPMVAIIPIADVANVTQGTNDENAPQGIWLPRAYIQGPTGIGWTRPEDGSDPARRYNVSVTGILLNTLSTAGYRAGFRGPPAAHGLNWALPALSATELG